MLWNGDSELFSLMRSKLFTAVVGDILDELGLLHQFLPASIRPLRDDMVVAGRAMPVVEEDIGRFYPTAKPFGLMLDAPRMEIPILKPPYGTLTAIDLNTGAQRWQVPLGDAPEIRQHPSLRDVAFPALLGVSGAPGAIVTKGGLLFVSGGGSVLYAIDRAPAARSGRPISGDARTPCR